MSDTRNKIIEYLQWNPAATYRAIMEAVGLKSTSAVAWHMQKIQRPPHEKMSWLDSELCRLRKEGHDLREAHDVALSTIRYLRAKISGALHTSANPSESLQEGLMLTEDYSFLDFVPDERRIEAHLSARASQKQQG